MNKKVENFSMWNCAIEFMNKQLDIFSIRILYNFMTIYHAKLLLHFHSCWYVSCCSYQQDRTLYLGSDFTYLAVPYTERLHLDFISLSPLKHTHWLLFTGKNITYLLTCTYLYSYTIYYYERNNCRIIRFSPEVKVINKTLGLYLKVVKTF